MMNQFGQFIVKRRWWIVAGWFVAAVLLVVLAPPLSSIESNDQSSFLPNNYESVQAGKVAERLSRGSTNEATDIVVFKDKSGKPLATAELGKINQVIAAISAKHLAHIKSVTTSPQQLAPSKKAQLATVVYSGSPDSKDTMNAVKTLRNELGTQLAGSDVQAGVTGQEAIGFDTQDASEKALKIVSLGTILLVLFLPAFVFRSPLAGLLPLIAVSLVFTMANALISIAGHIFNFRISQQLSVMFTVVLFGIGTDYILFLLFRYRERLRSHGRSRDAVAFALSRAGEAIFSAALVVLSSFAALFFAKFGIFSSFAPGLVICVAVMMLAAMTLVPALVAIIGDKVFWPSKAWVIKSQKPTISKKIGGLIARRPGLVATLVIVLLGGVSLFALGYKADFSSFSQPPKNTPSASAYNDLTAAFPAGALSPGSVYVTSENPLTTAELNKLTAKLNNTEGIAQATPAVVTADDRTAVIQFFQKDDPYSAKALDAVAGPIRTTAHSINSSETHAYVGGASAAIADVKKVTDRDLSVVFPIAAVFIFVILFVLLRSLVAPIVLLICVALGYVTTLGATTFIFENLAGNTGLISFIPLFLYLFVVAIGTDYNILTVTRLREEVREGNEPRKAADLTVEHSSATVVSAGIILAATFGSLVLGGIGFLTQMGASIAIGVMLAAFLIAPFLIPSLAARIGYLIWWPGHKPTAKKK
jgi:putative drug exporter of the RND superfamily